MKLRITKFTGKGSRQKHFFLFFIFIWILALYIQPSAMQPPVFTTQRNMYTGNCHKSYDLFQNSYYCMSCGIIIFSGKLLVLNQDVFPH